MRGRSFKEKDQTPPLSQKSPKGRLGPPGEVSLSRTEEGPLRFILSGCSGGGKSTLLAELLARGFPVFDEPGRRIVREQQALGGSAVPWRDPESFASRAIHLARADYEAASEIKGPIFYDRSLIDAISFLEELGRVSVNHAEMLVTHRYASLVFLVPPWREIFTKDDERQADFKDAVDEYERLLRFYPRYGYKTIIVPKAPVAVRADFVLREVVRRKRLADPENPD